MQQEYQFDSSMTNLEIGLRQYFLQRPDIAKKILSSDELSKYIMWMAAQHDVKPSNRVLFSDIPVSVDGSTHRELAQRALSDPKDTQALAQLSKDFKRQREEHHIFESNDIAVSRMLRYMPAHWHASDYFEIYYCVAGNSTIHFEQDTVHLKSGTVLIVAPGIVRASPCYADDTLLYSFIVRASTFELVFWNQFSASTLMGQFFKQALSGTIGASYVYFDTSSDKHLHWLLHAIQNELAENDRYHSQMINTLMGAFFIVLLRKYEGTARLPRTESFYWKDEFSAIFSFIQTNYPNATIETVASTFNYSTRQISRIVKNYIGINFAQLILKLKMEKAAEMLQQKSIPINNISEAVGYADVSSFYRAFIKYYQQTPLEFKESLIEQ